MTESALPSVIQASACLQDLLGVFTLWGIRGEFTPLGGSFFAATSTPGTWIQYTALLGHGDQLVQHRGDGQGLVVFLSREGCAKQITPFEPNRSPYEFRGVGKVLDDGALATMAFRKQTAIFYSISPHMAMSGMGWKMANAAAAKLGVKLLGVLDPLADRESVRILKQQWGVRLAVLRPLASNVLKSLGLNSHYPSFLYMKNGVLLDLRNASHRETEENYLQLFRHSLKLGE